MPIQFPAGTGTKGALVAADQFLIADSASSDDATGVTADSLIVAVADGGAGRNLCASTDINTIDANATSANILSSGTVSSENRIGSATHSTWSDGSYPSTFTLPNYAAILAGYDNLNNQQATIIASQHCQALGTERSGHNGAFAGSFHTLGGEYNFFGGGTLNESTEWAAYGACFGRDNTIHNWGGVVVGRDNVLGRDNATAAVNNNSLMVGRNGLGAFESPTIYVTGAQNSSITGPTNIRRSAIKQSLGVSTDVGSSTWFTLRNHDTQYTDYYQFADNITMSLHFDGVIYDIQNTALRSFSWDCEFFATGTQGTTSGWTRSFSSAATGSNANDVWAEASDPNFDSITWHGASFGTMDLRLLVRSTGSFAYWRLEYQFTDGGTTNREVMIAIDVNGTVLSWD